LIIKAFLSVNIKSSVEEISVRIIAKLAHPEVDYGWRDGHPLSLNSESYLEKCLYFTRPKSS
jgi:hypothetical protein